MTADCSATLTCTVLIPVNVAYNLHFTRSKSCDALSILTMGMLQNNWIIPHVVVTYLIMFFVIGFVYVHWHEVVRLRHN